MSARKCLAPYTQFQLVIRLHHVRRLVSDWPERYAMPAPGQSHPRELVATLQGIAAIARQVGLSGFASVCLQVCARVSPLVDRQEELPIAVRWLLREWSARSEMYIRHPDRMESAAAVVGEFDDSRWGQKVEQGERARLLQELLEPFA